MTVQNQERSLDIYLMGIGGTGMGALAGLLKQKGHRVWGSDSAVYSPMREKLAQWQIPYRTPYDANNLPEACDLVIVGNVIRRTNPEAEALMKRKLPYSSFPQALRQLFLKNATPMVVAGTHGKTSCSALLAHTLHQAGQEPGFLVGGIPKNFDEGFRVLQRTQGPFVVEGDEYDTAFFDKQPKFMHYDPKFLLLTSLEFDHADIYRDLEAVIDAFVALLKNRSGDDVVVVNGEDQNIQEALLRANTKARVVFYDHDNHYQAVFSKLDESGISFDVKLKGDSLGRLSIPIYGEHNLSNALGCYALLHQFGLPHHQIAQGFSNFMGVKRRQEELGNNSHRVVIDDFAHHPTAVKETIKAIRQKYPHKKICAIFEPRSATSCLKIFQTSYERAFFDADQVLFAPLGRDLPEESRLNTHEIACSLIMRKIPAKACNSYEDLKEELKRIPTDHALLFMSNGDFKGLLQDLDHLIK